MDEDYGKCTTCGRHDFHLRHRCRPEWEVWPVSRDYPREDGTTIFASDEEAAAEKWAEDDDSFDCDYAIVGGDQVTVAVSSPGSEDIEYFELTGQNVPEYTASPVNKPKDGS